MASQLNIQPQPFTAYSEFRTGPQEEVEYHVSSGSGGGAGGGGGGPLRSTSSVQGSTTRPRGPHQRRWRRPWWRYRRVPSGGGATSQLVAWAQSCLGVPQTGFMDFATRQAVRAFQAQQQLAPTGTLNDTTVSTLQATCGGASQPPGPPAGPPGAMGAAPGGPPDVGPPPDAGPPDAGG